MTHRRLELLQWYALFGGALAWTGQHVLGYFVSAAGCGVAVAHWGLNVALWEALLMGLALAAVLAAEAAAFLVYRATEDAGKDTPGPLGRLHFFAQAALVGNVLFLMLVLLDGVGVLFHAGCKLS